MSTWVTVGQACDMTGMSERSIRRHIADGKIESKLEGKRRLVKIEDDKPSHDTNGMTKVGVDGMVNWLKHELQERNKQIDLLQEELRRARENSDKIILKLTDELEAQRSVFEGNKSRQRRNSSIWNRFRRSNSDDG